MASSSRPGRSPGHIAFQESPYMSAPGPESPGPSPNPGQGYATYPAEHPSPPALAAAPPRNGYGGQDEHRGSYSRLPQPLETPMEEKERMSHSNSSGAPPVGALAYGQGATPGPHSEGYRNFWLPLALEDWFIGCLIGTMVFGCILMEVLLWWSNHDHGWPTPDLAGSGTAEHFLYTLVPVSISLPVVAMWGWVDFSVKKLQPFINLTRGHATADQSLFLDYVAQNRWVAWLRALHNRHYLVTFSTLIALFTLVVSPLASSLFVARYVDFTYDGLTFAAVDDLGLNPSWTSIIPFVSASGFVQAQTVWGSPPPTFVSKNWAIARFQLPPIENGTIVASTIAIKNTATCREVPQTNQTLEIVSGGFRFNVTDGACQHTDNVQTLYSTNEALSTWFGAGWFNCTEGEPVPTNATAPYGSMTFWAFDAAAGAPLGTVDTFNSAVVNCDASMTVFQVEASLDAATGSLLDVNITSTITADNNTVTGAPINGQPFNGVGFDLSTADLYEVERAQAAPVGLGSAIFQELNLNTPGGFSAAYSVNGSIFNSTSVIYESYLAMIASKVYFNSNGTTQLPGYFIKPSARLMVSPVAAHVLAAAFAVLAISGFLLAYLHRQERKDLMLAHEPGNIASIASLTGHTEVGIILDATDDERAMRSLLARHRYRLEPETNKIVFDGDAGFEDIPRSGRRDDGQEFGALPPQSPTTPQAGLSRRTTNRFGPGSAKRQMSDSERMERLTRLDRFRQSWQPPSPTSAPQEPPRTA